MYAPVLLPLNLITQCTYQLCFSYCVILSSLPSELFSICLTYHPPWWGVLYTGAFTLKSYYSAYLSTLLFVLCYLISSELPLIRLTYHPFGWGVLYTGNFILKSYYSVYLSTLLWLGVKKSPEVLKLRGFAGVYYSPILESGVSCSPVWT